MTTAPPQPGELTVAALELIATKLEGRFPDLKCEVCGNDEWSLMEFLVSPVVVALSKTTVTNSSSKFAASTAIICQNCGNTKTFTLKGLGLDLEDVKAAQ